MADRYHHVPFIFRPIVGLFFGLFMVGSGLFMIITGLFMPVIFLFNPKVKVKIS